MTITLTEKIMHEIMFILHEANVKGKVFLAMRSPYSCGGYTYNISPVAGVVLVHSSKRQRENISESNLSYLLNHDLKESDLYESIEPIQILLKQLKVQNQGLLFDERFFSLDITNHKVKELRMSEYVSQLRAVKHV